jgi:agmatinase
MHYYTVLVCYAVATVMAHGDHSQETLSGPHQSLWYNTLPGDGGTQVRYTNNDARRC